MKIINTLLIILLALFVVGCAQSTDPIQQAPSDTSQQVTTQPSDQQTEQVSDVVFEIFGDNHFFTINGEQNPTLRVNLGDVVTVHYTTLNGLHDWVIDEFDAATQVVRAADGTSSVTFVADQLGTFEYYCSVGSHRQMGMRGQFIVE